MIKSKSLLEAGLGIKCFVSTILLLFISGLVVAQDMIIRVKGEPIFCEVKEVEEKKVLYTLPLGGKSKEIQTIEITNIVKIVYSNGYIEEYKTPATSATADRVIKAVLPYDIIYTTTGQEIKGRVAEVDENTITYSLLDSDFPNKIEIAKVVGVRYSNGYEEAYNAPEDIKLAAKAKAQDSTSQSIRVVASFDLIKLKNGKEIKGVISEVDDLNIHYISNNAKKDKARSVPLSDILKVKYANGYEETYASATSPEADEIEEEPVVIAKVEKKKKREVNVPATPEKSYVRPVSDARVMSMAEVLKKDAYTTLTEAAAEPLRVEYLNLQGQDLKAVPAELKDFKNLIAINLSENKFKSFPAELLDLPNLQYVWLDGTGLQSLDFSSRDMEKLQKSNIIFISAKNNRLTKVSSSVLSLPYLQELKLSNNQISSVVLDKNFIGEKSNLQAVDLQDNRLTELPDELNNFPALTKLNLAGNKIKAIKKNTQGYEQLKSLKLNNNPLRKVDPQFYDLSSVEDVDLNQTFITGLPDSVSKLSRLRTLILPSTFYQFPKDFGGLKLLTELHVNNTTGQSKINAFPAEVLECQRLKTLNISGANLGTIPAEIANLKRLENLYLASCNITTLPNELFSLPKLKVLDLSNNKLTQVPGTIAELSSLETLNLQNSPLEPNSLLSLRRSLPLAQIIYMDSDFGLNFTSNPLPTNLLPGFKKLFAACDKGDPAAYYELGEFFKSNNEYGLAVKSYRHVTENTSLEGTGKSMTCLLTIAEIFDDVDNIKPYESPYKRKQYSDYTDYLNTASYNKAYRSYLAIGRITPRDAVARQAQKKANARASIISNEIAENLEKIFERNNEEIERLIVGSGDMQTVSAAGEKVMNDAAIEGSAEGALIGGVVSIFGAVASAAKEDKSEMYKNQNIKLKAEIESLKIQATELLNR